MDKGKSVVDPSSQGIWVSAKELYAIDSDDDGDDAAAAARTTRAPGVVEHAGDPGASTSTASAHVVVQPDISPFEDGQYVRLRNRGRGGYLFANETGRAVSVDRRRRMVNTAWAVQILPAAGGRRVLLRGAYGRYLSATRILAGSGLLGHFVAQCNFENRDDHDIEWRWPGGGTAASCSSTSRASAPERSEPTAGTRGGITLKGHNELRFPDLAAKVRRGG